MLRNEIYVVGGCFNQSLQENVHPFGFKYNVYTKQWSNIASMINERCGFFLGSDGKQLFAIGNQIPLISQILVINSHLWFTAYLPSIMKGKIVIDLECMPSSSASGIYTLEHNRL